MLDMIGNRLKNLRIDAGLSQPEFAAVVGTTKQYVSQLELGKNKIPNGRFLEEWARHFGVAHRWLVSGEGPKLIKVPPHASDSPLSDAALLAAAASAEELAPLTHLDPDRVASVAAALHEAYRRDGGAYDITAEPKRFVLWYALREILPETVTQDEFIRLGLLLDKNYASQGMVTSERSSRASGSGVDGKTVSKSGR